MRFEWMERSNILLLSFEWLGCRWLKTLSGFSDGNIRFKSKIGVTYHIIVITKINYSQITSSKSVRGINSEYISVFLLLGVGFGSFLNLSILTIATYWIPNWYAGPPKWDNQEGHKL